MVEKRQVHGASAGIAAIPGSVGQGQGVVQFSGTWGSIKDW